MTSLLPPQTSPMEPKEQPTGAGGAAATEATTVTIMATTTATVDAGTATTLVDVVRTITTTATEAEAAASTEAAAITGTAMRTAEEAAAVEADTPATTATDALATATTLVAGVVTEAAAAEADTVTTDAKAAAERITATTTAAAEVTAAAAATTVAAAAIAVTPRIATTTAATAAAAAVAVTPITRRATAHALTATPTIITAPTRIPQASSAAAVVPFRRSASMRLRGTKGAGNAAAAAAAAAGVSHSTRAHLDGSTTNGSSKPLFGETIAKFAHYRSWSNLGQRQTSKAEEEANATTTATPSQFNETRFHALCLALTEQPTELQFLDNMEAKSRNMSLKLNGGSAETAANASVTSTSTPKTPQTPLNGGIPSNHIHCSRSAKTLNRKQDTLPASASASAAIGKLSTVHETKISPKTPPVTPDSPSTYLDDDLDSMYSFATTTSGRSTMSCEHPYVARNGTTFSGRKMKYVVHCSNYAGQVGADYLTPTQRAQRQIRRLKELLSIARQDLEAKDTEILRLTREVVELRLFKASLSSPEERSASSDAVTVREAELKTSQDVSPIVDMVDEAKCSPRHLARQHQQLQAMQMSAEMQSSYADSGHFEDLTMSSVHSKDSQTQSDTPDETAAEAEAEAEAEAAANHLENYELQRQELIRMYEHRIEELIRTQDGATSDLKRSHNDKVEALLQKLAECNTRYSDIVPDYEHAKQRIRELEKQLEDLQRKLIEHEEKQNKMYLHMYQQGQEAERISRADQAMELAQRQPDSKVSINELLHQLQSTQDELENIRASECRMRECGSNHALLTAKEAISLWVLGARKTIYRRLLEAQKNRTHVDPEVTLQFLKSAIFYFLTDKENSQGHLQAIESILEFTEEEKSKINQARSPK